MLQTLLRPRSRGPNKELAQMRSFVEREQERRAHVRSSLVLPADLKSKFGEEPVFVLDVSRSGCRAVVSTEELPTRVQLRLYVPQGEPVYVNAETRWCRELSPGRLHAGFEMFKFADSEQEKRFEGYLDTITDDTEDLGVAALRNLTEDELQRMSVVVKASRTLNSSLGYTEALEQVIDVTLEALGAERGLFLLDRGGPVPSVEAARGPEALSQRGLAFSETVVKKVLESGEPLLSLDAQDDSKLDEAKSLQILGTVSVLCVPLRSRGRNFGLLYLDSSITKGLFQESDLALATVIADLASSSIERTHFFNQSVQREKLAAMGTLVAGLAHELLNPLSALQSLGECWGEGIDRPEDPKTLVSQANRCIHLVKDLLRLSRGQEAKFSEIDLKTVLQRVEGLVAADFRSRSIELTVVTQSELPPIKGNAEQLVQVLLNLLTNAVAALSETENGQVVVSTAVEQDLLRVSVADNGPGIPNADLQRIFDPFMTTKAEGHGLGLSIIQRLVQDHSGVIRAQNRPAGGATFTVEIPRLDVKKPKV